MRLFEQAPVSPEELSSSQRVFDRICPAFDKSDPPEGVESVTCTLIMLFQNGLKGEAMLWLRWKSEGVFRRSVAALELAPFGRIDHK
ncbi:hypothetical protein [Mesorhizobium wenxiniae]|nr:hypothetical protein [Mesorhizobium wenxiniae]